MIAKPALGRQLKHDGSPLVPLNTVHPALVAKAERRHRPSDYHWPRVGM